MKWTDLKNSDPLSDILELERKIKNDELLFGTGIVHIDHGLHESGFTVIVDDRILDCEIKHVESKTTVMEYLLDDDSEPEITPVTFGGTPTFDFDDELRKFVNEIRFAELVKENIKPEKKGVELWKECFNESYEKLKNPKIKSFLDGGDYVLSDLSLIDFVNQFKR